MVSRGRRLPGRSAADEQSAAIQVRLPANQLDQLMLLADHGGTLATTMVSEWVLERLAQLDPEGDLLPVPAAQSTCDNDLASVTRLPVMSAMSELPEMPELSGATTRHAATASVLQLRVPVGSDD